MQDYKEVRMFKNRFISIVAGAVLLVAIILIVNAIGPEVGAVSSSSPVGIGHLRSYEAQQAKALTSPGGMGDLRRFEAGKSLSSSSVVVAFDGKAGRSPGNLGANSAANPSLTLAQQAEIARWNALAAQANALALSSKSTSWVKQGR